MASTTNSSSFTLSLTAVSGPLLPDALSATNLDTIPVLHSILSRVQLPSNAAPTGTPLPLQSTPAASSFTSQPTSSQLRPDATGNLNLKEIPAATDGLKYRLQRARQEVPKIPGIKMTIEEQEEEIKEWEDKIVRQREELAKFKALARKVFEGMDGKADTEMGGMAES